MLLQAAMRVSARDVFAFSLRTKTFLLRVDFHVTVSLPRMLLRRAFFLPSMLTSFLAPRYFFLFFITLDVLGAMMRRAPSLPMPIIV